MQLSTTFLFVDDKTNLIIDLPRIDTIDAWEHPCCKLALTQADRALEAGWISPLELLSFLHLPLRRNQWQDIPPDEFGDCTLTLRAGAFNDDGEPPHQMILNARNATKAQITISFTEHQAERWAVLAYGIRDTIDRFR
jgi:hypothetical protein